MALSQLQCLDDNHVNPRTHESKPEFFYCEDQRLALEALLRDGREAFVKYLEARGLRGFLSDPELETLTGAVEPYDPGSELFSEDAEDGRTPLSLHYWPEVSDTSIPQMDLGWPDSDAYRGVTRTTVYTQPPLDGQVHVKEVVRKMIAQAQKVIAVVMDVFTDVDIFRDLLDAGFKRRVSVYILLERTTLPHFLSMCQRANMHAGHLKHLRVRCPEGAEFHTRFCTKVRGRMGHRFMFIDGDKAVSGSYSFTWMASRLDRNLITVVTGQAVEGFDRQFRLLYATSTSVDLRQIATEPEPEPDPLPQPVIIAPPSAAVARKLYNPKYALVALTNPSPTTSVNHESPKEPETPENSKKKRRGRASEDAIQEAPPLHPGLINLEKACLISYLPTWPEPDPPSDVIGFINIRNANKPTQFHLQRSEMFETSQAIRFSSPFSKAEKTLPEVAKPTHLGAKQPEQDKSKAGGVLDKAQLSDVKNIQEAPENKSPASGQKSELETTKTVSAENKFDSNTTTNQDGGLDAASLSPHTPPQSSSKALSPNEEKTSHTAEPVSTNSQTGSDSLQESNTEKEAESISILNPQCSVVYRTHTLTLNSTHTSELPDSPELNTEQDTEEKTGPSQPDSHTQAIHRQPQISSEMASNTQTPTVHSNISTSSASATQSKNNHIPITILHSSASTGASAPSTSSSSLSPPTSSFTTLNSPLPSPPPAASSPLTSTPPVPKPRTVQLVISDNSASSGQKLPDIYLVRKPEASTGPLVVHTVLDVAQTSLVKECQSVPELQDDSASKIGALKDTKNTENSKEIPKQETESKETRSIKTDGQDDDIVESQMVTGTDLQTQSDVLIIDSPKAASLNIQQIIPKDPQTSKDCRTAEKMDMDCVATVQADTKASEKTLTGYEFDKVPDEKGETQSRTFLNRAHEPQRISYCKLTPQDMSQLQALNSLKAPSYSLHASKDCMGTSAVDTYSQQGKQARVTHSDNTESIINTAKHNTHSTTQEQISTARVSTHTPEKTLRLHLTETHLPDFRSQTTEPELRSLTVRIPTPDGFFPRTPTPDSRTTTPDPRSYTSDYRTPTPDGYVSSREDSTLSTTSEEYFECSDSPFSEPVFDHMVYHNHEARGDHVSFTHTNIPHAAITGTSPAHSETQTKPTRLSSSSLLGKKVKMREAENTTNEENGSEEDKRGRKLSVDEKREEQEPRGTATVGSEETNRTVDHFEQDSTETAEKDKLVQVPVRKVVLNQDVADRLVDGGVTSGDSTKARTTPKHSSMGEPKPAIVSSEGERPDKESSGRQRSVERRQRSVERRQMSVERRQRSVERRQSPQSTRRTEGQKLLHTSPKLQRGKQRDRGASSPTQSPNSPRTGSAMQPLGPRPWVNRQPNQTESKEPQSSQNLSSLRKSPPRPPSPVRVGPVGSVAGRKQVSHSQQSNAPVLQGGIRTGQTQNQTPYIKPHTSLLHTNLHTPLSPQSHNQMASAKEAHGQEGRTPFSFTLSRLYNLKGMKAKVNKNPAQSKRGSVTAPVHERKSTS